MERKPHQIIIINGPRKSGKDIAAKWIMKEWNDIRHMKFSGPMKHSLRELFNLPDHLWKRLEHEDSGALKLEPLPELFGKSWVEVLMWYSEEVLKPKFGKGVFGKLLATALVAPTMTMATVISDSGFDEEVHEVLKCFQPKNVHVFQLFREGHTFAGDSRKYLDATDFPAGVTWWPINNDYDKGMYRRQILMRMNKIFGGERTYD